jgi:hypothetical protein
MATFNTIISPDCDWSPIIEGNILDTFSIDQPSLDFDITINTKSFLEMKVGYSLNAYKMTCSCPDFVQNRINFVVGDMRRLCKHLKDYFIQFCPSAVPSPMVYELLASQKTIYPHSKYLIFEVGGTDCMLVLTDNGYFTTSIVIAKESNLVNYYKAFEFNVYSLDWRYNKPNNHNTIISELKKHLK